ncbi:hypothetical protein N7470_005438 [Penicillium chermesinum]|nr:hypothetical protein N7470_005438 [Penicillium chermesinum]
MAPHLSHDEVFLLISRKPAHEDIRQGSRLRFLSQKPVPNTDADAPPSVVVRATDGNTGAPNPKSSGQAGKVAKNTSSKVKFSTIVSHNELEAFYARYADVCKTGMTGLKKRDRKRKAKAKGGAAKAKA